MYRVVCVCIPQMLLEVNSHMTDLRSSGTAKLDVLEIIPMQVLMGGGCGTGVMWLWFNITAAGFSPRATE